MLHIPIAKSQPRSEAAFVNIPCCGTPALSSGHLKDGRHTRSICILYPNGSSCVSCFFWTQWSLFGFGKRWGWESSSFYWVKTKLYAREPVCSLSHMKSRAMNSCCLNWFPQTAPICLALGVSILLVALLSSASLSARYVLLLGVSRLTSYQSLLIPPIFQPVKGKKSM